VSISDARKLLASAEPQGDRLRLHLVVGAALRSALSFEPIVVGGTAEEFWTAREYHETDLDLVGSLRRQDRETLQQLGFSVKGRHWLHRSLPIACEFPESRLDGDVDRTRLEPVGEGAARIIGVDDLYVDRLRQATVREEHEGIEFDSALAVGASCYDIIDWPYVEKRIQEAEAYVGEPMKRIDARIRRRVRRELGS
jgi:hypothetical protein